MHSPTSSEDSRLVRIVVPCAQTGLPRPRGHSYRDAFSSSSERRKRRAFRQACSAGHRASSEARGDVCSLSWSGGRFGSSGINGTQIFACYCDRVFSPGIFYG